MAYIVAENIKGGNMMLISDDVQKAVQERFDKLNQPVKMVYFESSLDCEYCPTTKQLVTELSELTDKLSLQVYNLHVDTEAAAKYGVDKVPAIVLLDQDEKDYGIKFYGIPSGYEFGTLLEDIEMVSSGSSGLSADSIERLKGLTNDVHIEVFVTPT